MARLHGDMFIQASYVKEVCRLLKTSNIQLVQSDIEFDEDMLQEEINADVQKANA